MHNADAENEPTPSTPSTKLDFSNGPAMRKNAFEPARQRAVKLRLLSLLGLLVLVIIAMKEAGKPERWMWLGFDKASESALVSDSQIGNGSILLQSSAWADGQSSGEPSLGSGDLGGGQLGFMSQRIASRLGGRQQQSLDQSDPLSRSDQALSSSQAGNRRPLDPQQSPVAVDFWRSAFARLGSQRQTAFYQLLRRVVMSKVAASEFDLPFEAAVAEVRTWHREHQTLTLGQLAVMSQGDAKTELTEQLFAFDKSWEDHVLPALTASVKGEEFTIADQSTMRSVKSIIDPIVMQHVQDLTGMGNPSDKRAWLAIWDAVLEDQQNLPTPTGARAGEAAQVSLLQLSGQPDAFRGQPVAIAGTALTIRRKDLSRTLLDLDCYYELWVAPDKTATDDLICVYVAQLPEEISTRVVSVSDVFQSIKLPVSVTGRFFKIRSYQDASKSVSHCPVVVAATFIPDYPSSASGGDGAWQPSVVVGGLFLIAALSAAIGIAYAVYRSTQSRSTPSAMATSRLNRSLEALAGDDAIMTDAQRVRELNGVLAQAGDISDEAEPIDVAGEPVTGDDLVQFRHPKPGGGE